MAEVAHDESVVEGDTASRKRRLVGEEGRLDVFDCQWTHLPTVGLKPNTIKTAAITSDGVANAAALKVGGRLGQ